MGRFLNDRAGSVRAETPQALVVVGGMALAPALILLILPVLILRSSRRLPCSIQAESRCYKMTTRTGSLAMLGRPDREARRSRPEHIKRRKNGRTLLANLAAMP